MLLESHHIISLDYLTMLLKTGTGLENVKCSLIMNGTTTRRLYMSAVIVLVTTFRRISGSVGSVFLEEWNTVLMSSLSQLSPERESKLESVFNVQLIAGRE